LAFCEGGPAGLSPGEGADWPTNGLTILGGRRPVSPHPSHRAPGQVLPPTPGVGAGEQQPVPRMVPDSAHRCLRTSVIQSPPPRPSTTQPWPPPPLCAHAHAPNRDRRPPLAPGEGANSPINGVDHHIGCRPSLLSSFGHQSHVDLHLLLLLSGQRVLGTLPSSRPRPPAPPLPPVHVPLFRPQEANPEGL